MVLDSCFLPKGEYCASTYFDILRRRMAFYSVRCDG